MPIIDFLTIGIRRRAKNHSKVHHDSHTLFTGVKCD